MCFGAEGIMYFNYHTWVVDGKFNKLEHWYNAEKANADIAFVGETLCDNYDYAGTYTINRAFDDNFIYLEDFYTGFDDVITDFVIPQSSSRTPYLVGCYDKKDGDGNAFRNGGAGEGQHQRKREQECKLLHVKMLLYPYGPWVQPTAICRAMWFPEDITGKRAPCQHNNRRFNKDFIGMFGF